jgi:hypothetical protein
MTSQAELLAGSKRPLDDQRRREVNLFSILTPDCSDAQLAHLVAQQQAFMEEAQSERHDRTINPGKGVGNSSMKVRLLNIVISGEMEFPQSLKSRLQVDPAANSNQTSSRSQRAMRFWEAVFKLSCRCSTVLKCLETGAFLNRFGDDDAGQN